MAASVWICTACTLENTNPSGLACELCQTERAFSSSLSPAAAACASAGTAVPDQQKDSVDDNSAVCGEADTYGINCEGYAGGDATSEDLDDRKLSASAAVSSPMGESSTYYCASNDDDVNDEDFPAKSVVAGPAPRLNGGKRSAVICLDDSSSDSDSGDEDESDSYSSGEEIEILDDDESVHLVSEQSVESPPQGDDYDDEDELPPPSGLHAFSSSSSSSANMIRNPYAKSSAPAKLAAAPHCINNMESHANATLKRYWGQNYQLRPFQLNAIQALCDNRDTLIISGTGSGKSVCYQLPPLLSATGDAVAIVISPLISLMRDQVQSLRRKGIRAEFVGSGQEDATAERRALNGEVSIVFVCPESLPRVGRALCRLHDRLFLQHRGAGNTPPMILAIDEAHCVSSWGNDFRPDYRAIGPFRRRFLSRCPCIALTATATPRVRDDMMQSLALGPSAYVAIESFNRPNIHYSAAHCENNEDATVEIAKLMCPILEDRRTSTGSEGPSAIVYCPTRNDCEDMAKRLNGTLLQSARNNGWRPKLRMAEPYHAGLSAERRNDVQRRWTCGDTLLVCATVAFGMGVDRATVRLVVHVGWPQSLEAFQQESGRAGRDGSPSRSVLLVPTTTVPMLLPSQGRSRQMSDVLKKMLWKMNEYGVSTGIGCRRRHVLSYFGEEYRENPCDRGRCCDLCDLKMARQSQSGMPPHARLDYLHDRCSISHLPTRPEPLLEASLAVLTMFLRMGATNLSAGVHSVKPFFVKAAEEGNISISWKWIRGLCRLLAREGWLGRDLHTITCTRPKADGRKKKGRRGKRKKRRSKKSAEVEVVEKRVEVMYITALGRALLAHVSSGEPLALGHDVLDVAKVRQAVEAKLACWPDLDMHIEAKANPRHLRTRTTVSPKTNGTENVSPQFIAGSSYSSSSAAASLASSKERPSKQSIPGTKRNNLIGWRAM